MGEPNKISRLDDLRIKDGVTGLYDYVKQTAAANPAEVSRLINDPDLRFTTLYLLENQAAHSDIYKNLNVRNKNALKLIRLLRERNYSKVEDLLPEYRQTVHMCLKWMLGTGYPDDGLNDDFDEILDSDVILLVQVLNDESVVPLLAEMIFNRNRQKRYIYDLVWTFFEVHKPEYLLLIADRLKSDHPHDVKLAMKLLHFVPSVNEGSGANRNRLHLECVKWIKDNADYLDYTGETFQQANQPMPYAISYESKYVHKAKKDNEAFTKDSLEEYQAKAVDAFARLNEKTKMVLSDFSKSLYEKDQKIWKQWIKSPLDEQLRFANRRRGRFI